MAWAFFRGIRSIGYGASAVLRKSVLFMIFAPVVALAEPVKIAALGDSLTQGYGLPAEDGLVPNLEAWLNANAQDVVLINAGVSGDTTAGGLSRAEWTLTPDVDGLIVALGGNDMLRALDPAQAKSNLAGILEVARTKSVPVLLVGIEAPSNYGPAYKEAFDAMYGALAEEFGTLYYRSFFDVFVQQGLSQTEVQKFLQSDRIHPNAEGVDMIVEGLGPEVIELIKLLDEAQ
ncbi:arylesterase [Algirhabdus cladophorae]|uniref:arylesterase n=1 Tax=Algirhabdus cladophorae TaxID=3377108 RepID=UPI003B84554F